MAGMTQVGFKWLGITLLSRRLTWTLGWTAVLSGYQREGKRNLPPNKERKAKDHNRRQDFLSLLQPSFPGEVSSLLPFPYV